jgi:hypothetical protein
MVITQSGWWERPGHLNALSSFPIIKPGEVTFRIAPIVLVPRRLVETITTKKTESNNLAMHGSPGSATMRFCNLKESIRRLLITSKNHQRRLILVRQSRRQN